MMASADPAVNPAQPDRRKFLIGGLMLAAAGSTALLRPRAASSVIARGTLARVLPGDFAAYRTVGTSSLILPPTSDLRDATYADILTRGYVAAGSPVYLLAACGSASEAGLTIHRAEDCYPAFGFSLTPLRTVSLGDALPAGAHGSFFSARRGERLEHVLYWVRVGGSFPTSAWEQRMAIARANLGGVLPDGVLLRLSVFGGDAEEALRRMQTFNAALLAALGNTGREVLLGQE